MRVPKSPQCGDFSRPPLTWTRCRVCVAVEAQTVVTGLGREGVADTDDDRPRRSFADQ